MQATLSTSVLALAFVAACAPRQAGDRCEKTEDCAAGLVCMGDACVDGVKVTKDRAKRIATLVQRHMHENQGDCPSGIDEFRSGADISDAWGREFRIVCPGNVFIVDVISDGPDGKDNTDDDIANVTPEEVQ
jgi:hypothetical protein